LILTSEVVVAVVALGGGVSAAIDVRTRRVPNAATMLIAGMGLLLAATHLGRVTLLGALGGFAVGILLMLPGHFLGATGAGDVKLLGALGTLLGPGGVLMAFIYTAIVGGIVAAVLATKRRMLRQTLERVAGLLRTPRAEVSRIVGSSPDSRFAYAPAIALGALVAALGL
jgi:prepilin peptidase CpaA